MDDITTVCVSTAAKLERLTASIASSLADGVYTDPAMHGLQLVVRGAGTSRESRTWVLRIHRQLTADHRGAHVETIVEDFQQVCSILCVQGTQAPVIGDQHGCLGEALEHFQVTAIAVRDADFLEQARDAPVATREALAARLMRERTGDPRFSAAGRTRDAQILPPLDPRPISECGDLRWPTTIRSSGTSNCRRPGMLSPSPSRATCARGKRARTAEPTVSTDNVVFIDFMAETSCRIQALHQQIAALRTDNAHTGHVAALTAAGVRERLAERDPGKPSMSWSNGPSRIADPPIRAGTSRERVYLIEIMGVPKGIRTPVTAVKGRCPGPLNDGNPAARELRRAQPVPPLRRGAARLHARRLVNIALRARGG